MDNTTETIDGMSEQMLEKAASLADTADTLAEVILTAADVIDVGGLEDIGEKLMALHHAQKTVEEAKKVLFHAVNKIDERYCDLIAEADVKGWLKKDSSKKNPRPYVQLEKRRLKPYIAYAVQPPNKGDAEERREFFAQLRSMDRDGDMTWSETTDAQLNKFVQKVIDEKGASALPDFLRRQLVQVRRIDVQASK